MTETAEEFIEEKSFLSIENNSGESFAEEVVSVKNALTALSMARADERKKVVGEIFKELDKKVPDIQWFLEDYEKIKQRFVSQGKGDE